LCWFNDTLFHRTGEWEPADVLSIPDPTLDAATKLYAAVEFMAREMLAARQAGTAGGPRDHHVMVVLSDGADNLSGFDNADITQTSNGATTTGARYRRFGWQATTLDDALGAIAAHTNLTVHVLAMGSNFQQEDLANLQRLADAGGGQLLENPDSSQVDALFQRVTKEFSTLQTLGASIPQQSGDHTFTLVIRGKNSSSQASQTFRYRAGPDAQLLP
jgi:hypothetical protein